MSTEQAYNQPAPQYRDCMGLTHLNKAAIYGATAAMSTVFLYAPLELALDYNEEADYKSEKLKYEKEHLSDPSNSPAHREWMQGHITELQDDLHDAKRNRALAAGGVALFATSAVAYTAGAANSVRKHVSLKRAKN